MPESSGYHNIRIGYNVLLRPFITVPVSADGMRREGDISVEWDDSIVNVTHTSGSVIAEPMASPLPPYIEHALALMDDPSVKAAIASAVAASRDARAFGGEELRIVLRALRALGTDRAAELFGDGRSDDAADVYLSIMGEHGEPFRFDRNMLDDQQLPHEVQPVERTFIVTITSHEDVQVSESDVRAAIAESVDFVAEDDIKVERTP